jgi:hypothetical protein
MTVVAQCDGSSLEGGWWELRVGPGGGTVAVGGGATERVQVSAEEWKGFGEMLLREHFFELEEQYGETVPDDASSTLSVTAGGVTKGVRVGYLMNWVAATPRDPRGREKLAEAAPAARLMVRVRGWISDERAMDLRRYYGVAVDAAGR